MGWRVGGTMVLAAVAVVVAAGTGCPNNDPECSAAGDCAALEMGVNSNAPRRAPTHCEGGSCVAPPGGSSALVLDLTTPRNVAVESIRYAVVSLKSAKTAGACPTGNCTAETVTCDAVKQDGMDAAQFNVSLGGVKNTSSQGGTLTVFNDVALGSAPTVAQLLVVDGRSGQLGAGDRLAWGCQNVSPAGTTTDLTLTLTPP